LQVPVVAADALSAALYVANYRFAAQRTDYLADASPSPLQHYWSLGVEEQFYLLWPLLLLVVFLAARRGRRSATRAAGAAVLAVVASGSFVLSVHQTAVSQPLAFFSLPTRAWELAAGGLVALAAPRLARLPGVAAATLGWLGLEAMVWSITRFGPATPFPGRRRCSRSPAPRPCSPPAAPPPGSAPTWCWGGDPSRSAAGSPTPGTCGTGRCWSWPRRWPATPSA